MDNQTKEVVTAYQAYIQARAEYDIKMYRKNQAEHYRAMFREVKGETNEHTGAAQDS